MDLNHLCSWLHEELGRASQHVIAEKPPELPPTELLERLEWLKERDEEVDALVLHYCRAGYWGPVAPRLRWALYARLWWGYSLLLILTLRADDGPGIELSTPATREGTIKWTLIDTWEILGRKFSVRLVPVWD